MASSRFEDKSDHLFNGQTMSRGKLVVDGLKPRPIAMNDDDEMRKNIF